MSEIKSRIISLIERNRISTVEVSDALGKRGVLPGLRPIAPHKHVVGESVYVYTYRESNWPLHEQIENLPEGRIAFVDSFACGEKALFGDLVAKYMILYRSAKAIVANGYVRDGHTLLKEDYPIWSCGVTPLGCENAEVQAGPEIEAAAAARKRIFDGSVIIADDSGVTMIEENELTETMLKKLEFIELQEDIWYYCIDTLKWSTHKTICQKAYLSDPQVLPSLLRESLTRFSL